MNLDDLVHFTMKEWTRMSLQPHTSEVERAKSQLKSSLLLSLDGTTAIAEDIGRQMITIGKRYTPKEIERAVNAVSVADVKRVAEKYLWDKDFAMAAHGRVYVPLGIGVRRGGRLKTKWRSGGTGRGTSPNSSSDFPRHLPLRFSSFFHPLCMNRADFTSEGLPSYDRLRSDMSSLTY